MCGLLETIPFFSLLDVTDNKQQIDSLGFLPKMRMNQTLVLFHWYLIIYSKWNSVKNIFLKNVQTNHLDISNIFFLAETIGQIWYKFADSSHQHESAFFSKQRILL